MTAELARTDMDWARRITERLRLQATNYADAREKVIATLAEARDGGAAELLGYASWTAYVADVLGDAPLRLERDARQELVAELAAEGMSTRAIAPIVGVSDITVRRDIAGATNVAPEPDAEPDPEPEHADLTVNTDTGEVIDAPRIEEHTVTEKTKVTTGLDGKEYKRPEPKPKPKVLEGDALADYDARQNTRAVADALQTLDLLTSQAHRDRVVNVWWPRAARNEEVPPWGRDLYRPEPIRQIAQALNSLANELENQS